MLTNLAQNLPPYVSRENIGDQNMLSYLFVLVAKEAFFRVVKTSTSKIIRRPTYIKRNKTNEEFTPRGAQLFQILSAGSDAIMPITVLKASPRRPGGGPTGALPAYLA